MKPKKEKIGKRMLNKGYELGKAEIIKDKKLVPIEKVMEIIEEWSNHQVTRAGHFTYDLIELKSKLGEIAK